MIVAAGLTPAWQQIMRFESFRVGEVNRATVVHRCASGKVLNVATALAYLGAACEVVTLAGGPTRDEIERHCDLLGIRRRFVETHSATRTCTTIIDDHTQQATELVENASSVTTSEVEQFIDAYAAAVAGADLAILSGSLPLGAPRGLFRDLLERTSCPAILDICGEELLLAIAERPFLVKPNREELAVTLACDLSNDDRLRSAIQGLHDAGAEWVVITDGPRPVWIGKPGNGYRVHPPRIEAVNPIASGDSLAAGIAWGMSQNRPVLDAICLGVAVGADNARQLLPAQVNPSRVWELAESIHVEPLL